MTPRHILSRRPAVLPFVAPSYPVVHNGRRVCPWPPPSVARPLPHQSLWQ